MFDKKEYMKEYMKKYYQENREEKLKYQKKWDENNKEHRKEYAKKYMKEYYIKNKDKFKEQRKQWVKNNFEKDSIISKRYREKNQKKIISQRIANGAFPVKQKCSIAGCNKLGVKHHPDYDKPLEIIWLCQRHHKELHIKLLKLWEYLRRRNDKKNQKGTMSNVKNNS